MKRKSCLGLTLIAVVASLSLAAHAQTYSVIYNFTGAGDGGYPYAGVTLRGGNLFGTTTYAGVGNGTVYELMRSGSNWVNIPLSALAGGGNEPTARVVFGPDGKLYGTTAQGGNQGAGVIFNLTPWMTVCPSLNCSWRENLVHQFQGFPNDGIAPWYGDLIWDLQGNIYGTTGSGGANDTGTVFELSPSGNGYTEQIIYSFPHNYDEGYPRASVIMDGSGNLFGTATGFTDNAGNVFELSYTPGVGWVESDLYKFQNGDDGGDPEGGLVMDGLGNLYGTTAWGGSGGGGTVFELSPAGNSWTFKVIYSLRGLFKNQNCGPRASLSIDAAGNLYGTTACDGANGYGSVFKLTNTQNGWAYTALRDFAADGKGANPFSNVTIDTDGTLYGTAQLGGSAGYGVVWMIKP